MEKNKIKNISKQLSYWLRHHPEDIGLELEKNGWTNLDILIEKACLNGVILNREMVEDIVRTSDKQRFSLNIDKTKIKANQGHSVEIEINFKKRIPPLVLYHGTAEKNRNSISKDGLLKMNRHHVHLSSSYDVALSVGQRHGKPLIFKIDTVRMIKDGIDFYISDNDVWLVEKVSFKYLEETIRKF